MPILLASTERERAAALWTALEARAGDWRLARSWDWTSAWLRHYGDRVPHRFAVWPDAERPRAMALVCESRRRIAGLPIRTAHVGTAGEPRGESVHVEYNCLLAEEGAADPFARGLLAALRDDGFDEIALDGFAAADLAPFLAAEPELELHAEPAPTAPLTDDSVIDALRSGVRQRVRRGLRGLGELECEWPEAPQRAVEVLEELIELHQRRWTAAGDHGAFASERFVGFHRDLLARLVPQDRAFVFRVRSALGTVGCIYGFVERERALFYQSGFGEFADNKLRPGLVSHALCMQACRQRGYVEYDFLAGESRYKRELASSENEILWAVARRSSAKQAALRGARALRTRLRP